MAGRGFVGDEPAIPHPRIQMLDKRGNWVPALDPIHYDKPEAGIGPGLTFAKALADTDDSITIGLIPAACGGSPISTWLPGGYHDQTDSHPYDDAVTRMKRAMEDGTLKAVLWHQGESDATPELSETYQTNLENLITRFRAEAHAPELPIVIGQLGPFKLSSSPEAQRIDQAHQTIARNDPQITLVRSDGFTSNPDGIHFNAESQQEFGRRYAKACLELIND